MAQIFTVGTKISHQNFSSNFLNQILKDICPFCSLVYYTVKK